MHKFQRRGIASLLILVMLVSLISSFGISVNAAEFSYQYDGTGKYIYNWGARGEVATFLSPNAKAFYEDNHTSYDALASYSGSADQSQVPLSSLYCKLQSLMKEAHSYQTSYDATKDLYQYTDCQNNGNKISSFYSGKLIGPDWDKGTTWNREHTWPNSKGLGGSDENDIMMLRPTSTSENSSRGNTAYGQSGSYYNPNDESGGQYDLRGDVARIFLYVYVRWGNQQYAWGTSGVMESVSVLLAWMEADPVDTWELGRNDSVESITGTRNVFVDYPELGFILFGREVPEDLATPSGEGAGDCGHNNFDTGVVVAATCTAKGYTLYTCKTAGCGYSYVGDSTPMTAHSYVNDVCTACGAVKSAATEVTLSFADKANRTEFSKLKQVWSQNGITLTNDKSSSTNDVADYSNPVRLYARSKITIEAPNNITKIVFDCSSSSYASDLQASIGDAATVAGDKVTVTLNGTATSFTVASLTEQIRLDSLTVTCATSGSEVPPVVEPPVDEPLTPEEQLDALSPYMSLAYKYTTSGGEDEAPGVVTTTATDTLNLSFTGRSATTSYGEWSGKTGTSGAVYAGQSAGGYSSIQLRATSPSGIVTTTSGGKVKKITVVWNSNTANGRTLDIYGKNSAYTQATDLYSTSTQGTKLGSVVYGTSTTLTVTGDYEYIGLRSRSGAQYIVSISIEWETETEADTTENTVYSNSRFAFRFGVDDALASIAGVTSYGLKVSAGGKVVDYTTDATYWKQEDGLCYVTVNLGDIINDKDKLSTKFTVQAYIVVDGVRYDSEKVKTYSVADMVKEYYETENIVAVEHLYNYLVNLGLI